MNELIWQWIMLDESQPLLGVVVVWMLRAAVIVFVAWGIERLARGSSSNFRHGVWICAFCSLMLIVLQLILAVPFRIPVRIVQQVATVDRPVASAPNSFVGKPIVADVDLPFEKTPRLESQSPVAKVTLEPANDSPIASERASIVAGGAASWISKTSIIALIYCVGLIAWLARIVVSGIRLTGLAKTAGRFSVSQLKLARECATRLNLNNMPDCRVSPGVASPLTFGVFRPTILVPSNYKSFSVDQQRHCLLHEMAHVAQRDSWWNWLAEVTTAVYWFHPCVHWARFNLRRTREDAADDAVVRSGENAVSYSRSLLDITQQIAIRTPPPTAAISSGTNLHNRIRRILAPTLRLDKQPHWMMAALGVGFLLLASTELSLEGALAQSPAARNQASADLEETKQPADVETTPKDVGLKDTGLFERFQSVELFKPESDVVPTMVDINFRGQVTDDAGPVAQAVVLIREFVPFRGSDGKYVSPPIVARTTTDQDGRYNVRGVALALQKSLGMARWEVLVADKNDRLGLGAFALTSFVHRQSTPWKASIDIKLPGADEIAGQIVTTSGTGINDVRVAVKEMTVPSSVEQDWGPFMRRDGSGFPPEPHVFRFPSDRILPQTPTDDGGRFAFRMPKDASLVLGVRRDEYFPRRLRLSSPGFEKDLQSTQILTEFVSPAKIELRRLLRVSFELVDTRGQPVKDFDLSALTPNGKSTSQRIQVSDDGVLSTTVEFLREATGGDGRVQLEVEFPFELGMLPLSQQIVAETVIADRKLRLVAQSGVRATGRVVTRDDGTGVSRVQVCWHSKSGQIDDSSLQCTTNPQGAWEMVIPQESGLLSVVGQSAGLDVWTVQRFNEDTSEQRRFTEPVDAGDRSDHSIPDFQIDRISSRVVTVVDINGTPVEGIRVDSKFIENLEVDDKFYRMSQELATSATTDSSGRCLLVLNRSTWEHGTVSATQFNDEDVSEKPLFTIAQAAISPDSNEPVKLVLSKPWKVTGKVLVDGRPAKDILVGLAVRLGEKPSDFYWLKAGLDRIDERGTFEMTCVPGSELFVAIRREYGDVPLIYYSHQPITKAAEGRYTAGTISISSDQL